MKLIRRILFIDALNGSTVTRLPKSFLINTKIFLVQKIVKFSVLQINFKAKIKKSRIQNFLKKKKQKFFSKILEECMKFSQH